MPASLTGMENPYAQCLNPLIGGNSSQRQQIYLGKCLTTKEQTVDQRIVSITEKPLYIMKKGHYLMESKEGLESTE